MISRKVAEQLVAKLREGTNLFVDVIDQKGVIQASLNHKCVGSFHKIAYDLIKGNRDFVNVEKVWIPLEYHRVSFCRKRKRCAGGCRGCFRSPRQHTLRR